MSGTQLFAPFALLPDGQPWGCTFFYKALA